MELIQSDHVIFRFFSFLTAKFTFNDSFLFVVLILLELPVCLWIWTVFKEPLKTEKKNHWLYTCICYRKSSWKLLYNLSVNNTKVDTRTSTSLTNSQLTSHLNFTSASGALYSIVNTSQTHYQATSVHSLYFRSFLATTDFNAVMKRLKSLWTTKLKDKSKCSLMVIH